jgi:cysteinyl-tRNA synthetase
MSCAPAARLRHSRSHAAHSYDPHPVQTLRIHNTLTRREEAVEPHASGEPITFYSCGPTVYDDAHIGNFRSFLNADVLRRTLELLGHRVHHVMNITDVGHMTDDSNADGGGEDKMAVAGRRIAEAKKAGKLPPGTDVDPSSPGAIADFYAGRFLEDARALGLKVALEAHAHPKQADELMPRPTRCIPQMITMIERLVASGHAYVAGDGVVYFDVRSFPAYGALSGNTIDRLREGAGERISAENQAQKRHPADFMLWKPDMSHLMRWPSPWGEGYPGWHIECSAMARMLLGDEIDIHSGGEDNIFPHHECEVAQSRCATGRPTFARHWFHTRHLVVEGEKMSKSKGNFFTARDLFAKGHTPAALRLELIRTHYRSNANFTVQGCPALRAPRQPHNPTSRAPRDRSSVRLRRSRMRSATTSMWRERSPRSTRRVRRRSRSAMPRVRTASSRRCLRWTRCSECSAATTLRSTRRRQGTPASRRKSSGSSESAPLRAPRRTGPRATASAMRLPRWASRSRTVRKAPHGRARRVDAAPSRHRHHWRHRRGQERRCGRAALVWVHRERLRRARACGVRPARCAAGDA